MSKKMLIAGCSHAAGSEIDGTSDSKYNRDNSFGNTVAKTLGYEPVNICQLGFANSGIARSVVNYCMHHTEQPSFVLVAWTDSIRVEAPFFPTSNYKDSNEAIDWYDSSAEDYLRVSALITNLAIESQREAMLDFQSFTIRNEVYNEINNIIHIINLQNYLKLKNIPYVMVNTNYMFEKMHSSILWYFQLLDEKRYPNFRNNKENFYPKYKRLGYENKLAKYFHHGIEAHQAYAKYLTEYILENNLTENT